MPTLSTIKQTIIIKYRAAQLNVHTARKTVLKLHLKHVILFKNCFEPKNNYNHNLWIEYT